MDLVTSTADVESLVEDQTLAKPEDLPPTDWIRLASYNVRNLFGEYEDVYSGRPDEPIDPTREKALVEVIRGLDADVVAFQEVQNERVLSDMFRKKINPKLSKEARFTSFVLIPARDPRGINVAIATRLAVQATLSFHDRDFGPPDQRDVHFSRDLLGAEIYATPTYRLLQFVAHLKAKLGGDRAEEKRRLEAEEIRSIIEKPVFGGNPYVEQDMVLAGDMNDDPKSSAIQSLRGHGAKALIDALADVDPNYTYPTHNKYKKTRFDYLFLSPTVRARAVSIYREPPTGEASDHYPVTLELRTKVSRRTSD